MPEPTRCKTSAQTNSEEVEILVKGYFALVLVLVLFVTPSLAVTTLTISQFGAFSNSTLAPLGGGTGYSDIKTSGTYTVTNTSEFLSHMVGGSSPATNGQVVYIVPTANINLTGIWGTSIPAGVTVASNRGSGGSSGGRIFNIRLSSDPNVSTPCTNSMLCLNNNNTRVTGLRIEGSDTTTVDVPYEYSKNGIEITDSIGSVVDNNEISGWALAAVITNYWYKPSLELTALSTPEIGSGLANVNHNYIHNCQAIGQGYGFAGSGLVKANVFDFNRHSVTMSGGDTGYEASYNLFLGNNTDAYTDVHGINESIAVIAGDTTRVTHNTFRGHSDSGIPYASWQLQFRGVPRNVSYAKFNSFINTTYYTSTQSSPPVMQFGFGGYGNVSSLQNTVNNIYIPVDVVYHCPTIDMYDYSCGSW